MNYSLAYENSYAFENNISTIRQYFLDKYELCIKDNIDLWISSENISSRFILEEIDPIEKFKRIQLVLPENIQFVIIFRNIWDSLRSVFYEYIKRGYSKSFDCFCNEVYLFRESNFLNSFIPTIQLNYLSRYLCNNNQLLPVILKDSSVAELNRLLAFLNSLTGDDQPEFPQLNKSMDFDPMELLDENRQSFSRLDATGLIEMHRLFYDIKDDVVFEDQIWTKLSKQKHLRDLSKNSNLQSKDSLSFEGTLLYDYLVQLNDEHIQNWLMVT